MFGSLQLSDGTQSCGASISIAVEPEGERKGPLARLDVVNLKAWQRLPQDVRFINLAESGSIY